MRGVRRNLLLAALLTILLANGLVFGALSERFGKPTPRPTRTYAAKTFTPNPELARRRITQTPTRTATPTRFPTSIWATETREPFNARTK